MATTLTIKGQVTIPKNIRDALDLQPGCKINFAVSDSGDVLLQKADSNRKLSTSKKSKQVLYWDRNQSRVYITYSREASIASLNSESVRTSTRTSLTSE